VKCKLAHAFTLSAREPSRAKGGAGKNNALHLAKKQLLDMASAAKVSQHLQGKESAEVFRQDCYKAAAMLKREISQNQWAGRNPKKAKLQNDFRKARWARDKKEKQSYYNRHGYKGE